MFRSKGGKPLEVCKHFVREQLRLHVSRAAVNNTMADGRKPRFSCVLNKAVQYEPDTTRMIGSGNGLLGFLVLSLFECERSFSQSDAIDAPGKNANEALLQPKKSELETRRACVEAQNPSAAALASPPVHGVIYSS